MRPQRPRSLQARARLARSWLALAIRDTRAATSVEFAMLAAPFFLALLVVAQIGIQLQAQSALHGVAQKLAEELALTRFSPPPNETTLRLRACALIAPGRSCPSSLVVDLAPISTVTAGPRDITADRVTLGPSNAILVLRLQMDGAFAALVGPVAPRLRASALLRNA